MISFDTLVIMVALPMLVLFLMTVLADEVRRANEVLEDLLSAVGDRNRNHAVAGSGIGVANPDRSRIRQ